MQAFWDRRPDDGGFSLIEVMVAMSVVGVVMSALATFFASTISITNAQSNTQSAIQLVNDSLERVRALRGSAVTNGRDRASTAAQWAAAPAAVSSYLSTMAQAYDTDATSSASAALPMTPQTVTYNGVTFSQSWYVGQCWQPLLGGDCAPTQSLGSVGFYRVITLVTWGGRRCPENGCTQLAPTLISSASTEPVFKSNQTASAPQVVNPGRQNGELTVPVDLTLTATGGAPPLTWAAAGLPPGLAMDSSGRITGTPTQAGTYAVTVTATDGFNLIGSAAFAWVVAQLPALTSPGPQTSQGGVAITALTPALTGGTSPLTWTASGLPAGLQIDASSGAITGTPTAVGTGTVTVNVSDTYGKTATTSFTWTIPPLTVTAPAAQIGEVGVASAAVQVAVSGGIKPYTWTTTSLPAGLSITAAGLISGTPTTAGTYATKLTATDAAGATASTAAFTWTIRTAPSITWPRTTQTGALGTQFSVQGTASGGTSPYTWSTANLPTGAVMSSSGVGSGPLAATGRYLTTLSITDALGGKDSVTFEVNVTSSTALRITSPTGSYARSDTKGRAIASFTAAATGGTGTGAKTWTATGLPAGVTMNGSSGLVSGTPTTAGTYTTKLTVTDSTKATSNFMFSWTIA
jgi:prepilin-type N-terminal cleavage/methylation domain-containing protein